MSERPKHPISLWAVFVLVTAACGICAAIPRGIKEYDAYVTRKRARDFDELINLIAPPGSELQPWPFKDKDSLRHSSGQDEQALSVGEDGS